MPEKSGNRALLRNNGNRARLRNNDVARRNVGLISEKVFEYSKEELAKSVKGILKRSALFEKMHLKNPASAKSNDEKLYKLLYWGF